MIIIELVDIIERTGIDGEFKAIVEVEFLSHSSP
jgi:ribosomal protein S28E/S33